MNASKINTQDNRSLREKFKEYKDGIEAKKNGINSDLKIMVYPYVKDYKNGNQFPISEVINDIRTNSDRKNFTDKGKLPVAYFSASMIVGRKLNENVTKHSGFFVIDIDKDKNLDVDLAKLKQDLQNDKFTYACFNSPSGGIKVVIHTNLMSIEHHEAYFMNIKEYLLSKYIITEIDQSGCNIARACYMPYDKDIYYNIHASKYSLDKSQLNKLIPIVKLNKSLHSTSKQLLQVDSISYDEHYENILKLLKKRTEVGLYTNIFNDYRYKGIGRGVMDTTVPFLELIILKNLYPYKLDWETQLDELYFKEHTQKHLNVLDIGCRHGIEICKIGFRKGYIIKEHFRAKTLGSFSMKLIFNNPFCHPDYLIREVQRINNYFSEDPNPSNPKPNDEEVRNIVMQNYISFLNGELDFSKVVRTNPKTKNVSPKYVFKSKQFINIVDSITHLEAVRTYREGKNRESLKSLEEAINVLQDGKRITQKRIANHMEISTRTIRRYMTGEYHELIDRYNKSVKKIKKREGK